MVLKHYYRQAVTEAIVAEPAQYLSWTSPKLSKKKATPIPVCDELAGNGNCIYDLPKNNLGFCRLFGGLVEDIKRKAPFYLSDFKEAFHVQCFASFFFLYFACLTPIITFGGLLVQATGGYLGAIESILSGTIVGVTYALFSGQPLTIMGSTGPVLVFESIVYQICEWDIRILSGFSLIGFLDDWSGIICRSGCGLEYG